MHRVRRSDNPVVRGYPRLPDRISAHPSNVDSEKLARLPATAEALLGDRLEKWGFDGSLKVLLAGTRDNKNSPLATLREHEATICREIYSYVSSEFAKHVKLTVPAALVGNASVHPNHTRYMQFNFGRQGRENKRRRTLTPDVEITSCGFDSGFVAFARCGRVEFPQPAGRNVNMMPFVFGDQESLPENLKCYFPLIEQCPYMMDDVGKVGYLTVHESYVAKPTVGNKDAFSI